MKNTILFDMDGVLVLSEPVIVRAAIKGLEEYGISPVPSDFTPFVGMGENMFIGGVARKYGLEFKQEMKKRVYDIYDEIVADSIAVVPGVFELLKYLEARSVKMAIVSSADRRKILSNLRAAKIDTKYFNVIISGEDVERRKPFPDIFIEAAKKCAVLPENCYVLEDAVNGVQAAVAAMIECLGITTSFNSEALLEAGAIKVFSDLAEVRNYFETDPLSLTV